MLKNSTKKPGTIQAERDREKFDIFEYKLAMVRIHSRR